MNNMNYIPMSVLEYRFNDEGITEKIIIALQHYQGNEQINARVSLTQEYVQSVNERLELDTMNKEQIENHARRKLTAWISEPIPEETPVEEPVEE